MAGQKPAGEGDVLQQIEETWGAAREQLASLREAVERASRMGQASSDLNRFRSEREAALLKLGEAFYKLVESGQFEAPPELKRALGDVKTKDIDLIRQQADIAAILKEADALVDQGKRVPAKKKLK